jgi:uracil permease
MFLKTKIKETVIGVQYLFVAFGATVLVPLLVGLDPSIALFAAGIGTLIFHLITKGKVPVFLGSSFAFIAPIIKATELYGMPGTMSGIAAVGLVYGLMSLAVKIWGPGFIGKLFPPIVIGPVIILIGLSLASTGVNMAGSDWLLAGVSLTVAVLVSLLGKGMLKLIPILAGIVAGYVVAWIFRGIDLSPVKEAAWIALPSFTRPSFSLPAIFFLVPVAIAPVIEHIGDVYAIGAVTGKDYVKDPGLHRTMLGDGVACFLSGLAGGPPVTTYSEVTGAITLTKVSNPYVLRVAAVTAILFSVIGKVNAVLCTIPQAVMGGIMLLLFGSIASIGINNMITNRIDFSNTRNLIIVSLILTVGIGGAALSVGNFSMTGIGLAALLGVVLNLVLPHGRNSATHT